MAAGTGGPAVGARSSDGRYAWNGWNWVPVPVQSPAGPAPVRAMPPPVGQLPAELPPPLPEHAAPAPQWGAGPQSQYGFGPGGPWYGTVAPPSPGTRRRSRWPWVALVGLLVLVLVAGATALYAWPRLTVMDQAEAATRYTSIVCGVKPSFVALQREASSGRYTDLGPEAAVPPALAQAFSDLADAMAAAGQQLADPANKWPREVAADIKVFAAQLYQASAAVQAMADASSLSEAMNASDSAFDYDGAASGKVKLDLGLPADGVTCPDTGAAAGGSAAGSLDSRV